MPSRWMTLAIVAFWLAAMGWMTVREIAPRWRTGEPPPYVIDLTDEVSTQKIHWQVFKQGVKEKIGSAASWVERLADRTFALRSDISCEGIGATGSFKVSNTFQVTHQGELINFSVMLELAHGVGKLKIEITGKMEEGYVTPHVVVAGHSFSGSKAEVRGSILNSLQMFNKLSGRLAFGQRWSQPLLDPSRFVSIGVDVPKMPRVDAEVVRDVLVWNGQEVACFLINYRQPGESRLTAQTWVRQSDGVMLQQRAIYGDSDLVSVRQPTK